MRYIVGLSGTHGTGKTTIMNGVKDAGFSVAEAQLSRSAQAQLGWDTLKRVEESEENMWALQNAILDALIVRDASIEQSTDVTLVERTPADLWAYTETWCFRLGINPVFNPKAVAYKDRLREACRRYDLFVVVKPHENIPFIEEPNRADLASRKQVERAIDAFTWDTMIPTMPINTVSKDDRIAEAVRIMQWRTELKA